MTYVPEVLYRRRRLFVASVVGMFLPIRDINVRNTTNQKLQFAFIKNIDQVRRNQLIEACRKSVKLFLDPFLDPPFCYEPRRPSALFEKHKAPPSTYSTYSRLFSSVTEISFPPGLSSIRVVSPKRSSSTAKSSKTTSSISFSLGRC